MEQINESDVKLFAKPNKNALKKGKKPVKAGRMKPKNKKGEGKRGKQVKEETHGVPIPPTKSTEEEYEESEVSEDEMESESEDDNNDNNSEGTKQPNVTLNQNPFYKYIVKKTGKIDSNDLVINLANALTISGTTTDEMFLIAKLCNRLPMHPADIKSQHATNMTLAIEANPGKEAQIRSSKGNQFIDDNIDRYFQIMTKISAQVTDPKALSWTTFCRVPFVGNGLKSLFAGESTRAIVDGKQFFMGKAIYHVLTFKQVYDFITKRFSIFVQGLVLMQQNGVEIIEIGEKTYGTKSNMTKYVALTEPGAIIRNREQIELQGMTFDYVYKNGSLDQKMSACLIVPIKRALQTSDFKQTKGSTKAQAMVQQVINHMNKVVGMSGREQVLGENVSIEKGTPLCDRYYEALREFSTTKRSYDLDVHGRTGGPDVNKGYLTAQGTKQTYKTSLFK